jgi:hypothetical protein
MQDENLRKERVFIEEKQWAALRVKQIDLVIASTVGMRSTRYSRAVHAQRLRAWMRWRWGVDQVEHSAGEF